MLGIRYCRLRLSKYFEGNDKTTNASRYPRHGSYEQDNHGHVFKFASLTFVKDSSSKFFVFLPTLDAFILNNDTSYGHIQDERKSAKMKRGKGSKADVKNS